MCADCWMRKFQYADRLTYCSAVQDSAAAESNAVRRSVFFPPYCVVCEHEREMLAWRTQFGAAFEVLRACFETQPDGRAQATLAVAEAGLARAGCLPSCAVPPSGSLQLALTAATPPQASDAGPWQGDELCDFSLASEVLQDALFDLHKQPWIRDQIVASARSVISDKSDA